MADLILKGRFGQSRPAARRLYGAAPSSQSCLVQKPPGGVQIPQLGLQQT